MTGRIISILVVLILMVISALGGFYFGLKNTQNKNLSPAEKPKEMQFNSIFTDLQAHVAGTVVGSDENNITVKTNSNQIQQFRFADNAAIFPVATSSGTPIQPTNNKSIIKPQDQVVLTIGFRNNNVNDYVVTSVSVGQSPDLKPPAAKNNSSPKPGG